MARLAATESFILEQKEGNLGRLASALVLLDLVELRVGMAVKRQPGVLSPALDDLQRVRGLIRAAQHSISALPLPCSRPSED
jgi:hypothetical protein